MSNPIYIVNEDDKKYYVTADFYDIPVKKTIQIHRPLPYPILLTHAAMQRLEFPGYQGEAIRALPNGRFHIVIQKGNRSAKLLPDVDFQWNDVRFEDDTKTQKTFDDEKDNLLDSYQKETSNASKMLKQTQHKYYKPTYQDKHYRPTFYSLYVKNLYFLFVQSNFSTRYHPSSKTSITNFLAFLNLQIDLVLQNGFYDYVTNDGKCLEPSCLLYNTTRLIWSIYVRKEVPQKIRDMNLNRETLCNYHHLIEKIKFYLPNMSNNEISEWHTFHFIMNELYKKVKRHCVE
jgi:hypothetical protein